MVYYLIQLALKLGRSAGSSKGQSKLSICTINIRGVVIGSVIQATRESTDSDVYNVAVFHLKSRIIIGVGGHIVAIEIAESIGECCGQ